MQITLDIPDSLTQTDTFNQSDWLREIAIALFQQERITLSRASKIAGIALIAIALALELQADDLLVDERLGRREARQLGLSIIGIPGILVTAKQRSLIPKVQPVMDALIHQARFRISLQLYQRVLNLSSEP